MLIIFEVTGVQLPRAWLSIILSVTQQFHEGGGTLTLQLLLTEFSRLFFSRRSCEKYQSLVGIFCVNFLRGNWGIEAKNIFNLRGKLTIGKFTTAPISLYWSSGQFSKGHSVSFPKAEYLHLCFCQGPEVYVLLLGQISAIRSDHAPITGRSRKGQIFYRRFWWEWTYSERQILRGRKKQLTCWLNFGGWVLRLLSVKYYLNSSERRGEVALGGG